MKCLPIFLMVLSTAFSSLLAFAQDTTVKTTISTSEGTKISLVLPINVIQNNNVNLSINIPEEYKSISGVGTGLMEFIPKTDIEPYAWSEIITVFPYIGEKLSAKMIVYKISQEIKQVGKDARVLDEKYYSSFGYEQGYAVLVYTHNGRREVIKVYGASGPFDSVMVQKAVLINSDKDIEEATRNINNYFNQNVIVLEGRK